MTRKLTYLDSNILISAFQGGSEISNKAFEVMFDIERDFIVSEYLRLETIPKPSFYGKASEVEFFSEYFNRAHIFPTTNEIVERAVSISSQYDITPIDSLHVCVAIAANVDEFITLEKNTKPMFKVAELNLVSIR